MTQAAEQLRMHWKKVSHCSRKKLLSRH